VDLKYETASIHKSRVAGAEAGAKTKKSRRTARLHPNTVKVLRDRWPIGADPDDYVFTTLGGCPDRRTELLPARLATCAAASRDQRTPLLQHAALVRLVHDIDREEGGLRVGADRPFNPDARSPLQEVLPDGRRPRNPPHSVYPFCLP
jgi:hypothetical protein